MGYSSFSEISNIKNPTPPPHIKENFTGHQKPGLLLNTNYLKTIKRTQKLNVVIIILGVLSTLMIYGLAFFLTPGGVSFFLAFIPLSIVILSSLWVGRWNPAPPHILVLALLWGSVISVLIAVVLQLAGTLIIPDMPEIILLAVQAPLTEELTKGMFILLIALFFKKYYISSINGIVYTILVAGGFAFTENILYLSNSFINGGWGALTVTFFLRGMLSPFAHALFTLPLAILLGWGVRKNFNAIKLIGLFTLGYIPAVILHSLWNLGSYIVTDSWAVFYTIIQIPLFVGAAFLIYLIRKQEINSTLKGVTYYAWQGWFTPEEVETFATFPGRAHLIKWAKSKQNVFVSYVAHKIKRETVEISLVRENLVHNRDVETNIKKQNELLASITEDKTLLSTF